MTLEFTEQDFTKLNELIQQTPFKYAYPLFQFFQGKVAEANQIAAPKVSETKKKKVDGNQDTRQ
jgi:hypothetical protein